MHFSNLLHRRQPSEICGSNIITNKVCRCSFRFPTSSFPVLVKIPLSFFPSMLHFDVTMDSAISPPCHLLFSALVRYIVRDFAIRFSVHTFLSPLAATLNLYWIVPVQLKSCAGSGQCTASPRQFTTPSGQSHQPALYSVLPIHRLQASGQSTFCTNIYEWQYWKENLL